jgi:hypothetical protein
MKKTFEYDLTKFSPDAPTRTEEFITADGVKTLTTDANDGAVLIQNSVDKDSLNPVTAAAVSAAIEAGGGGGTSYSAGDGIDISDDTISAKVDGTTIGVNASGELEALGGGGSSLEAGDAIKIQNDKINVRVDVDSIKIKSDTVVSSDNDYTYDYRNIDLWSMTSGTKCDWAFGSDSTSFNITATAAQAGCQIRAALYDGNGVRISVSSKYFTNWGMPKTLVEGTNSFNGGWQWTSMVRPSGATFATEFPLPEGRSYEDVATIALVAYDATNSQVVGNPLPFTHNSNIQFKLETDANSKLSVKNPLPDSSGASQGDVLKIGSEGPEWGAAGGESYVDIPYQVWSDTPTTWQTIQDYMDTHNGVVPLGFSSEGYVYFPIQVNLQGKSIDYQCIVPYTADPTQNVVKLKHLDEHGWSGFSERIVTFAPGFDIGTDVGKVLKVTANGLAWVTP